MFLISLGIELNNKRQEIFLRLLAREIRGSTQNFNLKNMMKNREKQCRIVTVDQFLRIVN
uniref:Uncharacterized protein n=1 Tax=Megaselia scalaris TaxID=36166 RepID=T1H3S6_MEGSC